MIGPTEWRLYSSDAAMPKLPPPPRIAQNRSGFCILTGALDAAIGHHELRRAQVVERQAVLGHQPSQATAERQAGDAGRADDAAGSRQPVHLRFAVQFFPQHAALRPRGARHRIDVDAFHRRQIDHHAAIDGRPSGHVVTAAADGDFEIERTRQLDRVSDVGRTEASRDERRTLVDQAVVHAAGFVVSRVGRLQQLSGECRGEFGNR